MKRQTATNQFEFFYTNRLFEKITEENSRLNNYDYSSLYSLLYYLQIEDSKRMI